MVRSMTGFGRAEVLDGNRKLTLEIKSVNHRYLDLSIRMPRRFNPMEARIRAAVKEYAERGKVDLYISYQDYSDSSVNIMYNSHLAEEYMGYFRQMSEQFGIENDVKVSDLCRMPDIFAADQGEEDEDALWELLDAALKIAGAQFVEGRAEEGQRLKDDILEKLDGMEREVDQIEAVSPEIVAAYQTKLTEKVKEATASLAIDEARILTEVALYADRVCTDEETVRLRSHISGMRQALTGKTGEAVGRKLDFIAQEMNREANTTLSKCNNMDISATAVHIKTEIEKIREQVQNIE